MERGLKMRMEFAIVASLLAMTIVGVVVVAVKVGPFVASEMLAALIVPLVGLLRYLVDRQRRRD
jgi:hypothetical protein